MAIKKDLVINKRDLVKDKLFHLNEPFQLINSREKVQREFESWFFNCLRRSRALFQIYSCFISQWIAIVTSVNSIVVNWCTKSFILNGKQYTLMRFELFNFNSPISQFRAKTKPLFRKVLQSRSWMSCLLSLPENIWSTLQTGLRISTAGCRMQKTDQDISDYTVLKSIFLTRGCSSSV